MQNCNESILCNIKSCKFHDNIKNCQLSAIQVGGERQNCKNCSETQCSSFECR